jgi:hypothetical protein
MENQSLKDSLGLGLLILLIGGFQLLIGVVGA